MNSASIMYLKIKSYLFIINSNQILIINGVFNTIFQFCIFAGIVGIFI